jgi:outer membrane beta-barrel protein
MMHSLRIGVLVCLAAVAVPQEVRAQTGRADLTDASPVRGAIPLRSERHQVAPLVSMTFDDPYLRDMGAGIKYRYYFTNWLGLGVDFVAHFAHIETSLTEQIEQKLSSPGASGAPSTSGLGILGTVAVCLVPLHGKFIFLGKLPVSYDVHVYGGAGFGTTQSQNVDRIKDTVVFSSMFGFGARFFLSRWVAFEIDARDYMMNRVLAAPHFVENPGAEFTHNWMVTAGVSFFFPPEPEREL